MTEIEAFNNNFKLEVTGGNYMDLEEEDEIMGG